MSSYRQATAPEWKQFLQFSEKLIQQKSASAQCSLIKNFLKNKLESDSEVWLAEPNYPLPGETVKFRLPDPNAPAIVQECFKTKRLIRGIDHLPTPPKKGDLPNEIAIPLVTKRALLGVLHVVRSSGPSLSKVEIEYLYGLASHAAQAMQIVRQRVIKNWRYDQLELVRLVSSKAANLHEPDQFSYQVTRLIQKSFKYYYVAIFALEENQKELCFQASAAANQRKDLLPPGFKIKIGEGIVGTSAQTGKEIISSDVHSDPLFRYFETLPETASEVALPLRIDGNVLGVLDLQSTEPHAFHTYDMLVLRALADNIATAMESMRLIARWKKHAGQISALLEISHSLTSILEVDPLLDEIVKSIQRHFGYDYVHIFNVHQGQRKIYYEAGSGARSQAAENLHLTYDLDDSKGIIPYVARSGKTLLANDVTLEPYYRPSILPPPTTCAELAIPLLYAGEVVGVLDLQSEKFNNFSEGDVPLLEALSASIAIAIRNARLYQTEVWRRQVADSFREIASLVSANTALDDLLEKILSDLDHILPCDANAIWLVSQPNSTDQYPLHLARAHGIEVSKIRQVVNESPQAKKFLESVMKQNSPVIRLADDPIGPLGMALGFSTDYSSIAAPLKAGDHPLGVLTLAHKTNGRYGNEAGSITMTFANSVATAIQNNQLFAAAQEQAWISTILLQIAEATQGNQSVEELFETMARLTPLLVGIKKCAFFLFDESDQTFSLKSNYGLNIEPGRDLKLGANIPIVSRMIDKKEIIFIEDANKELGLVEAALPADTGTLVILPLAARGRLLGAFLVGHQSENRGQISSSFDQQTLALLQGIAQQTTMALENLELFEARQEEAYVTAVLLQVAQAVVSQNDLEDILDTIVHLLPILVGVDSCGIYLWEEKYSAFRTAKVFTGSQIEETLLEDETYRAGEFPLLDAVRDQEELVACKIADPDTTMDDWHAMDCLLSGEALENEYSQDSDWIMGVPLSIKGEVYGVLLAKEANVPEKFHNRRIEILNGVAQQISLAIQNERLNLEMVQRERLQQEIDLARQIQKTFLPSRLPKIKGWELEIHWQTAREVGGDFYDAFRVAKDRLGLVIADVSDKGMPAALYMTVTRTLIRAFSQKAESPARVLERVNRSLVVDSQDGLFVTAIFAILNIETGQLIYANAGHNLPILVENGSDQHTHQLIKGGTALGISSSTRLEDHVTMIEPNNSVFFYTDGLTESFSPKGEIYGEERLLKDLDIASNNNSAGLIEYLRKQVNEFRHGAPPSDDMTLVLVHRKPQEPPN